MTELLTFPSTDLVNGDFTQPSLTITGESDPGSVNLTYYDRLCGTMPDGAAMFIGHSQVQSMPICDVPYKGVNLGYGGVSMRRTFHHMERTAFKAAFARAGACVFLHGCTDGSNTAYYGSQTGAVSTVIYMYDSLLKPKIQGPWVIVKPLPGHISGTGLPSDYNTAMTSIGDGIDTSFASVSDVAIVDVWDDLVDAQGELDDAYHIGDGQHLSKAGYGVLMPAIGAALDALYSA